MNLKNKTHKSERATAIQRAPQVALNANEHERSLNPVAALQRATGAHPSALRPADILTLQRTVGNRAVQRMLSNRPRSLSSPPSTSAQIIQRQTEEEEPIQAKSEISARSQNRTGLPDRLKTGIENLSGLSLDDVRVHRNSSRPAELQARAFTQGTDIHVGPDEEEHLPHEAWHVVQQKQGRVRPTLQMKRVAINDDAGLEKEADVMGAKAAHVTGAVQMQHDLKEPSRNNNQLPIQLAEIVTKEDQSFDDRKAHKSRGQTNPHNLVGTLVGGTYANVIKDESDSPYRNAHMMAATFGGSNAVENIVAWIDSMEDTWTAAEGEIRGATSEDLRMAPRANEEGEVKTVVTLRGDSAFDTLFDDVFDKTKDALFDPANWVQVNPHAAAPTGGELRGLEDYLETRLRIRMNTDIGQAVERMPEKAIISYASAEPDDRRKHSWRFNDKEEIAAPQTGEADDIVHFISANDVITPAPPQFGLQISNGLVRKNTRSVLPGNKSKQASIW